MKFIRRSDLTFKIRINIITEAIANMGNYGAITQLAQTYKVSRTFIYSLINNAIMALYLQFYSNFLPHRSSSLDKLLINKIILLHRLEGNSSIERISNMLHYNNISPSSVGYISNCLTYYGKGVSVMVDMNQGHLEVANSNTFSSI